MPEGHEGPRLIGGASLEPWAGCDALKCWQGGRESHTSLLPAPAECRAAAHRTAPVATCLFIEALLCYRAVWLLLFFSFPSNVSKCVLESTLTSGNLKNLLVLRLPGMVWCVVTLHCMFQFIPVTKVAECGSSLWC